MVRRRKFIRIISYLVAVCVVFAASGVFSARAKSEYESTLERVRLEGLASLTEYSREISSGLRLLAVSSGESLTDSSAYVSARAAGAMGSLGCFYSEKVDNLTRFFSGLYDFSENFSGSESSRKAAVRLSDYAQDVYYHLSDLTNAVVNGAYSLTEYKSIYEKNEAPYFEDELDFYNGTEDEIFSIIEPAAALRKYDFLSGKESISEEDAKLKASEATGIQPALWRNSEKSGSVDLYSFVCGDTEVDICRQGGIIFGLVNPRQSDSSVYTIEDARKKAVEFFEIHGFENMVEIWSRQEMFSTDFVFVPEINGVLLMTAEIKISVCLSSGKITRFDASDYISRYRRDITAQETVPEISSFLPYGLKAEKIFLCVADIDGREKLCILAVCPFDKDNVYIFVDYYSLTIIKTLIA